MAKVERLSQLVFVRPIEQSLKQFAQRPAISPTPRQSELSARLGQKLIESV
jgi:hypothetical protein